MAEIYLPGYIGTLLPEMREGRSPKLDVRPMPSIGSGSWSEEMPNANKSSKPDHITTGDILEDLGFSPQETLEAKVKSDLWRDLLVHIERRGFNQAYLKKILHIHQPDVSNLLRGKISKFSTGKLIQFAVRLGLDVRVQLREPKTQKHTARSVSNARATKRGWEATCA